MQAQLFHALSFRVNTNQILKDESKVFRGWLIDMLKLALEKLISLNLHGKQKLITEAYQLIIEMLRRLTNNTNTNFITRDIVEINEDMYKKITKTCAVLDGQNSYSSIIDNFYRDEIVEDLKKHNPRVVENSKEIVNIHKTETMRKYDKDDKDDVIINKDIDFENIINQSEEILKQTTVINYFQMKFFYSNLPIKTLHESQWMTILEKDITNDSQHV